jgi:hypothetical protein
MGSISQFARFGIWITFFQYPDSAIGEIDLHDTAAEEVDTQNSIYRLLTTVTNRTDVDRQDRFWKDDAAGCRLQIVDAISKTLPIHALYLLRISEVYAQTACFLEIDSVTPAPESSRKFSGSLFPTSSTFSQIKPSRYWK